MQEPEELEGEAKMHECLLDPSLAPLDQVDIPACHFLGEHLVHLQA